jgi:OmpA-OmpF porin, OOP family
MRAYFVFIVIVVFCFRVEGMQQADESEGTITIKGRVFDDHNKAPLPASVSVIISDAHPIRLTTEADGSFSVPIPPSSWCIIKANAAGFDMEENEYDLKHIEKGETHIKIYLTPYEKLKMSGVIRDKKTLQPVEAEFDLYYDTDIVKEDVKIAGHGSYEETFTKFGWYLVDIFAKGYLNTVDTIWVMNLSRVTIHKDYFLTPIEEGLTVRLNNVYFDFGKATLTDESFPELNRILEFVKRNPTLQLEIGGHTDAEGEHEFNLLLSKDRAKAVVDYLVSKGASQSQLTFKGYGELNPVDMRQNHIARAANRRVEFKVLKKL